MNLIDFILLCFGNFWMGMTAADILSLYKRMKKCPSHYIIPRRELRREIYASMVIMVLFIIANIAYYTFH